MGRPIATLLALALLSAACGGGGTLGWVLVAAALLMAGRALAEPAPEPPTDAEAGADARLVLDVSVGPCLSPPPSDAEARADVERAVLEPCLCACELPVDGDADGPPDPASLVLAVGVAAALRRRRRADDEDPREAARRRVLASGALPPDVVERLRREDQ